MIRFLAFVLAAPLVLPAQNITCDCDPARPETLKLRQCSLTNEALKQPDSPEFFFLKDNNPRKPNRWLILPRGIASGMHTVSQLPAPERTRLWKAAIAKAEELFGTEWGLAYNGERVRTQCHLHIHIGRFLPAAEASGFRLIRRVEQIPVTGDAGLWLHPVKGGFHVHAGEQIAETVLLR